VGELTGRLVVAVRARAAAHGGGPWLLQHRMGHPHTCRQVDFLIVQVPSKPLWIAFKIGFIQSTEFKSYQSALFNFLVRMSQHT
jgi:hypothetical protein